MGIKDSLQGMPNFMWQSSQAVAEEGFNAVMSGKVYKVNGFINQILAGLLRLLPRSVFYGLGRRVELIPTD